MGVGEEVEVARSVGAGGCGMGVEVTECEYHAFGFYIHEKWGGLVFYLGS